MSIRYVWDQCNVKPPEIIFSTVAGSSSLGVQSNTTPNDGSAPLLCKSVLPRPGTLPSKFGYFVPDGDYVVMSTGTYYSCAGYPYVIMRFKGLESFPFGDVCAYSASGYWSITVPSTTGTRKAYLWLSTSKSTASRVDMKACMNVPFASFEKGSVIQRVTNANYNKYTNGLNITGYPTSNLGTWYDYLGIDNIDPVSVSCSGSPASGKNVNVIVTPGSNTYGGTVSYIYQYSLDGVSWKAISTTTMTSVSFTIPSGMQSIQFRVCAKDDLGFISDTYVLSETYYADKFTISASASPAEGGTVSGAGSFYEGTSVTLNATPTNGWEFVSWKEGSAVVSVSASYTFMVNASRTLTAVFRQKLRLWVGVSGKARKGTAMWIGVNGKARKVVGAWVGVNGKARRFL